MDKLLHGGAVINYGPALPTGNLAYDGYLFFKNAGNDAGLYLYSYETDSSVNVLGQAQVHAWNPIATTELFVSKLGDTMTGSLDIVKSYTNTGYSATEYALNLANVSNTAGARTGAIQWRYAGATSAVSAQIDIVNGTSNSSSVITLGTRGPTGAIAERVRVSELGLTTPAGKRYWNEDNDGTGSGLDADLLDGQDSSFYRNATNINAGTLNIARLPYTPIEQGGGTNQGTNKVRIGWASTGAVANTLQLQIDTTNYANIWPISITGNASTANTANSAATATTATNSTNSQFMWFNGVTTGGRLQFNSATSATSPTFIIGANTITAGTGTTISQFYNVASLSVGSAVSATRLESARTINGVSFDGTQNITIADATKLPLTGGSVSGILNITNNTDSSAYTNGALVVTGGVGIGRALNVGGNISALGTIASTSDARVKTDIRVIKDAGTKVAKLSGNTYDRTDIEMPRQAGVIAQEVLEVLPEAVLIDDQGRMSVNYNAVVALLVEAVKDLQAEVAALKERA